MALEIYYQRLWDEIFQTFKRFPLAILCSLAFCYVCLNYSQIIPSWMLSVLQNLTWMTSSTDNRLHDVINYTYIFFCGACWFVAVQLFWEGRKYKQRYSYLLAIPIFLVISCYIQTQHLPNYNSGALALGLFLLGFCAPYLKNSRIDLQFWVFSYHLWLRIGYAFVASCILFLGITAILSCLDYLFSLKFYKDQYKDLQILTFTFLFPIIILSGISRNFDEQPSDQDIKPFYYLLEYLVIPFLFIYSIILYAYMIKIVIQQSLPRGGVVYLVASYGEVGLVAYLISIPKKFAESRLIHLFRHHFFKILLFPTLLLGVAISYRLYQYGLTESRYMVVLSGVLLSVSILLSFLIQPQYFAKIIFTLLPCLLLLASVGPWSINSLPALQQVWSLEKILRQNNMLKEGQLHLVTNKYDLNEEDKVRLSEILDYLCQNENRLKYLKPLFNETVAKKLFENNRFLKGKDVAEAIGFEYVKGKRNKRFEDFSFGGEMHPYLPVKEYDYIIPSIYLHNQDVKEIVLPGPFQNLTFSLNSALHLLSIKNNGQEIFSLNKDDILPLLKIKADKLAIREKLTLPFKGHATNGLLIIQNISGSYNNETNDVKIFSLQFSLLIGKK